jgi:hypothetical protein
MRMTTFDILKLELMEKCNCGSGLEVLYYCKNKSCPDHENEKYYCINCSYDNNKHDHRSLSITKELEAQHEKWQTLRHQLT